MTHPLLTPRYMVEAPNKEKGELPYPNSPFRVGDILTVKHHPMYNDGEVFGLEDEQDEPNWITYPQDFPHIFRPMYWSEQRELGEMPEYVKTNNKGIMLRVFEWVTGGYSIYGRVIDGIVYSTIFAEWCTPATEAEYLEYLKSKEK